MPRPVDPNSNRQMILTIIARTPGVKPLEIQAALVAAGREIGYLHSYLNDLKRSGAIAQDAARHYSAAPQSWNGFNCPRVEGSPAQLAQQMRRARETTPLSSNPLDGWSDVAVAAAIIEDRYPLDRPSGHIEFDVARRPS